MFTMRNAWDWKRSYCLDCTSIDWSTTRCLHHCPNSAGNKVALSSSTLKSTRTSCRDLKNKLFCSSGELMESDNSFCWWRKSVHHANQPKGGLSHYSGICTSLVHDCLHQKHRMFTYVCFSVILSAVHQSGTGFCLSTCLQKTCAIPSFAAQMPKPQSRTPNFLLLEMLF